MSDKPEPFDPARCIMCGVRMSIARGNTHLYCARCAPPIPPGLGAERVQAEAKVPSDTYTKMSTTWLGDNEIRSVSATGGEKGTKLERFDLIPDIPLRMLARHYGKGAEKYAERNWERGYDWSKSFAALNRHLWAFWGGEDIDAETSMPHMIAVAWHAMALVEFSITHPEFDDRPTGLDSDE